MPFGQPQSAHFRIVERRRKIRIMSRMPGWYALADYKNTRGEGRQFTRRALNISDSLIALPAPRADEHGERVIAHIDGFGTIEGVVICVKSGGLVIKVAKSEEDRFKLIDKINIRDQRTHTRFFPANTRSRLMLADGALVTCRVIDLSEIGAAISATTNPEIGTVVAVGTIIGRVVRHFAGGFALKFFEPQVRNGVEAMAVVIDEGRDNATIPLPRLTSGSNLVLL